jgi:hypothetical protein
MENGKLKMNVGKIVCKTDFRPDCISDRNSLNASLDEIFCLNTYVLT